MPDTLRARLRALLTAPAIAGAIALCLTATAIAADTMNLTDALGRAAAFDPGAPGADARIAAAEAGLRQAGVRPNPMVGVDLENFGGTGRIGLFDQAETTVYYQQSLERGGKLEARQRVAQAELALARTQAQVRALDLLTQVQIAWVEAQAAEAAVTVAGDRVAVAERLERDVGRRVASARDPLFMGERARTAVAQARVALEQAREQARAARTNLAAFWGAADAAPDVSALFAVSLGAPPPLGDTPDLLLIAGQRDLAQARISLEKGRAVQDPVVRGGVRHFANGGDAALVLGASIPLGRYDTNQGAVEKAQAERLAADLDLAAARLEREREVARLTARRAAAVSEISRIDSEIMPSAERAVRLVREGFDRGGGAFTYVEVVEAERAVLDARARRIELLKAFHLYGARLDRLLAVHLSILASLERR